MEWSRVTSSYLEKYTSLIDIFFDYIKDNQIKIRIMFTQNRYEANSLTKYHRENEYFLLYYQFLKHAFGLQYANHTDNFLKIRLLLDELPETREKVGQFKSYINNLEKYPPFRKANLKFPIDQISGVDSSKHVILQCLDIILGAMQFRLNDKHKFIPVGKKRRGARTIAKEKLYKYINQQIQDIYPKLISDVILVAEEE